MSSVDEEWIKVNNQLSNNNRGAHLLTPSEAGEGHNYFCAVSKEST